MPENFIDELKKIWNTEESNAEPVTVETVAANDLLGCANWREEKKRKDCLCCVEG